MHGAEALPRGGPETVMSEAILIMTAGHFGCVGIVDDSRRLIGILTDGDLRRHMNQELMTRRAGDIMTAQPRTIRAHALAAAAVSFLTPSTPPFLCCFVVEYAGPPEPTVGLLQLPNCP